MYLFSNILNTGHFIIYFYFVDFRKKNNKVLGAIEWSIETGQKRSINRKEITL